MYVLLLVKRVSYKNPLYQMYEASVYTILLFQRQSRLTGFQEGEIEFWHGDNKQDLSLSPDVMASENCIICIGNLKHKNLSNFYHLCMPKT